MFPWASGRNRRGSKRVQISHVNEQSVFELWDSTIVPHRDDHFSEGTDVPESKQKHVFETAKKGLKAVELFAVTAFYRHFCCFLLYLQESKLSSCLTSPSLLESIAIGSELNYIRTACQIYCDFKTEQTYYNSYYSPNDRSLAVI